MIEQILPDLFRIEIPLPNNPLRSLNSYLIRNQGRFLMIDTGMNRKECLDPMISSLQELEVDLNKTDFFITHMHVDHLGLVGELSRENSKIYFNRVEAPLVNLELEKDKAEKHFRELFKFFISNGFPEEELQRAFADHPGRKYRQKRPQIFSLLKEGDTLNLGNYFFRVIETPGHSPGHMCLYEAEKKILVAGDHILFDITPNITWYPELGNPLKSYLASLEKVSTLDINLVLPGHRSISQDYQGRIKELQEHHKNRLDEVLFALEDGEKTCWQIAPYISWDIDIKSWEQFPGVQKWFAFGETLAHILFLEAEERIKRKIKNDMVFYFLE
jgi:glyoxylase-like metal-dependent hydrolase (beta-lactamase superfamily II)